MSEQGGRQAGHRLRIRGPQDLVGGLVLMAVAGFALFAARDLPGLRGFTFGPGTAPRLFAGLLLALGAVVALGGLVRDGDPLQRYGVRGPVFVTAALILFAVAIRPLGLIPTGILTFLLAALGSPETRWGEALLAGVLLTIGCALLFPFVLGLPFQMWPQFLQR